MSYKYLLPLLLVVGAVLSVGLPGCKPREEELQLTGGLAFSADTVKFDTVFTTLRTVTKRLWVYNRNPKGVAVDLISLDSPDPATSPYTLLINGDLQQTARKVFIRGQDSLLILVRAKLPDNGQSGVAKAYVVEEKLNFRTNGQDQPVVLRSFGQNIYLHAGTPLPCGEVWRNDRPHVLYGTVTVPASCTLTIKPGTRIYAHAGAMLLVKGTLVVNSPADFKPSPTDTVTATSPGLVRFTGDRTEAVYRTVPGQWAGLVFDASSQGNLLRYTQIHNSTVGLLLYNPTNARPAPDVQLQNSSIRYISGNNVSFAGIASDLMLPGAGIVSIAGQVSIENSLFTDCYEYALLGYGGTYDLNYCTIANYPATGAVRQNASLKFSNSLVVNNRRVTYEPVITMRNSIVWGSTSEELSLENYQQYAPGVSIRNSLLKTQYYARTTDTGDQAGLANAAYQNLFTDPLFAGTGNAPNYRLQSTSPAYKRGTPVGSRNPTRDLVNLPRDPLSSLGAYESTK
jgi:hypothetical protein